MECFLTIYFGKTKQELKGSAIKQEKNLILQKRNPFSIVNCILRVGGPADIKMVRFYL